MSEKKKKKEDYHGISSIQNVMKQMKKEYDNDPKDWRVIGSSDNKGNTDTFIGKKPNTFWLKSKMLSPYSALSMGTVVRNIDKDIDEKVGKKMSPTDMLRLFGMAVPINQDKMVSAAGIEKYSQEHGDYLKTIINEKQSNLGHQLGKRLDEEFTKKHPQRKNLYI